MKAKHAGRRCLKSMLPAALAMQTLPAFAHTLTETSASALLHNLAHTEVFLIIMVIFSILLLSAGTIIRIATSRTPDRTYLTAGGIGLVLSGITLMISV